ncbi:MAG: threonine--tRNA ligase [Planctomycetota bacterium]
MIRVTLPDESVLEMSDGASSMDVAARIGEGLAKAAIGAAADCGNGEVRLDLATPLSGECRLRLFTQRDMESLEILRHSTAHVMAEAICKLWPQTRLVYGPPIENGFYYDIDMDHRLTPEDFPKIEAEMARIVKEDRPFTRCETSREEGLAKVRAEGNPYKLENARRAKGETLSFYVTGPDAGKDWEDLCTGTHVPSTGKIGAFKVLNVSGAFLHGDAKKQQLQRVTGTAFFSKKELKAYLHQLEEAKKRDHRRLGQELGLFALDSMVGSGLVLWKPKGAMVRYLLEQHMREQLVRYGYTPVYSPQIGRLELYRTSGHFPYYRDCQYPPLYEDATAPMLQALVDTIKDRDEEASQEEQLAGVQEVFGSLTEYFDIKPKADCCCDESVQRMQADLSTAEGYLLRPMNCPHHIRIYKSEPRSYKDLPVRLAEFGTVYRYEQSGEVSGLTRVRGFTQDDAHVFCMPEQLQDELSACMDLSRFVLESLGLKDYRVRVGLHDPDDEKFIDNPEAWEVSEAAVRAAAKRSGMEATEEKGEATFYGPKIDFVVKDCIGREWQLGTVQVDYNLPERFGLEYVGYDNAMHRPVMIHRAPFGSLERFMGILIEHFEGAFPLWLAPTQVAVASISEKSAEYAKKVAAVLGEAGLRVELDVSAEKIGPKKHRARKMKTPYIAVVGEQEAASGTVDLNDRDGRRLDNMELKLLLELLLQENQPGGRPEDSKLGA